MAGCKIVNQGVLDAVAKIETISAAYKTAGEQLVGDLTKAIAEMEGETKDALQAFIDKDVKTYVEESLPEAVKGMSTLLEANRSNFEKVDSQIAQSITGTK